MTYKDSKDTLELFRLDKVKFPSEWAAVKYGAEKNFYDRLGDSIIWPFKSIQNFIPYLVLKLNPRRN